MAHFPPATTRFLPSLLGRTHTFKEHLCTLAWMLRMWWQLTSVADYCVEGEVTDAPLSADCGPWWLTWMVVLNHQRETAPGEVGAHVLLTHHHTHTVAHAAGTGWECKNNIAWNVSFNTGKQLPLTPVRQSPPVLYSHSMEWHFHLIQFVSCLLEEWLWFFVYVHKNLTGEYYKQLYSVCHFWVSRYEITTTRSVKNVIYEEYGEISW